MNRIVFSYCTKVSVFVKSFHLAFFSLLLSFYTFSVTFFGIQILERRWNLIYSNAKYRQGNRSLYKFIARTSFNLLNQCKQFFIDCNHTSTKSYDFLNQKFSTYFLVSPRQERFTQTIKIIMNNYCYIYRWKYKKSTHSFSLGIILQIDQRTRDF